MRKLLQLLVVNLLFFYTFAAYAGNNKLLLVIEYENLDVKLSLDQHEAVYKIAQSMLQNRDINIVIESSAYKDYVPIAHLRAVALKRAMEIRKILNNKNIEVDRVAITVKDLEKNQDNITKIYKAHK